MIICKLLHHFEIKPSLHHCYNHYGVFHFVFVYLKAIHMDMYKSCMCTVLLKEV